MNKTINKTKFLFYLTIIKRIRMNGVVLLSPGSDLYSGRENIHLSKAGTGLSASAIATNTMSRFIEKLDPKPKWIQDTTYKSRMPNIGKSSECEGKVLDINELYKTYGRYTISGYHGAYGNQVRGLASIPVSNISDEEFVEDIPIKTEVVNTLLSMSASGYHALQAGSDLTFDQRTIVFGNTKIPVNLRKDETIIEPSGKFKVTE
jgi:hypothetical protein